MATPLSSSSSASLGPDVVTVAAAMGGLSAEVGGSWVFCPGQVLPHRSWSQPRFLLMGIYLSQQVPG